MAHQTDHQQAYAYADFSSGHGSFENNHGLFELQAGMEMLGMPSEHFYPKPEGSSSGSGSGAAASVPLISPDAAMNSSWQKQPSNHLAMNSSWQKQPSNHLLVDDPSSLRCLFPGQGSNDVEQATPNRGLSLSLTHPAESSELQQTFHQNIINNPHQQHPQQIDAARFYQTYQLKSSMYLIPAQELLNEFCNLGGGSSPRHQKSRINKEGESSSSPSNWNLSALFSMDILELQQRKAKLLSMLEEVDRRYKRYCEQMRAVVSSFEAVAGRGSADVYSMLAWKTISRHFRWLRDGMVGQIQATKKAMGEKDPVAPGTTKGETPRLKMLDQCLRQQKAFQQAGAMDSQAWRPQRGLPEHSVSILRAWLFEHFLHPYPSDVDKHILARQTGLSRSQVSNWFINARVRLWKPMVEEMYMEETKEQDKHNQSSQGTTAECESVSDNNSRPNVQLSQSNRSPNPSSSHLDQKPLMPAGHLHIDSDSLTSIINNTNGSDHRNGKQHQRQVPRAENFGVVDLDFSSYNECSRIRDFGNGVSLTLGLQQHNGAGMSLSFSPTSQQSIFFSGEQMEDCQPVQFSILEEDQGQNLPYRNLMGAQLLHDLAG